MIFAFFFIKIVNVSVTQLSPSFSTVCLLRSSAVTSGHEWPYPFPMVNERVNGPRTERAEAEFWRAGNPNFAFVSNFKMIFFTYFNEIGYLKYSIAVHYFNYMNHIEYFKSNPKLS